MQVAFPAVLPIVLYPLSVVTSKGVLVDADRGRAERDRAQWDRAERELADRKQWADRGREQTIFPTAPPTVLPTDKRP